MLLADMRRASKTSAGICVLLVLGVPSMTRSQPAAQQEKIQDLLQTITAIESRDGETSEQLIDPLTTLGRIYQDSGKPFQSASAISRALDLTHVNEGLYTLEQAPLLRLQIRNAEAVGDPRSAWDIEQQVLALASRHPDDVRAARILRETADRRMELLDRYIAGQKPAEIVLGCYYGSTCKSGQKDDAKRNLLREAQSLYLQAADVLQRSGRYAGDELQSLLENLVGNTYHYGNPELGRQSLVSLLDWQNENARASSDKIRTSVEIADWDLFHSRSGNDDEKALHEYMDVYELLIEQGAQELLEQIFAPEIPIVLPTFSANPLARVGEERGGRFVDVAFEIDERGKSRHIRVIRTIGDPPRAAAKQLLQYIAFSHFRPRLVDGRLAGIAPVVVRYYFE
jgi:hypothetical protein